MNNMRELSIKMTVDTFNKLEDTLNDAFGELWDAAQRENAHPMIAERAEFIRQFCADLKDQYTTQRR
jgi:hypothetical protein